MIDPDSWICPLPLRDSPCVVTGHGGGGILSAELIKHLFLPAFGAAAHNELTDAAVIDLGTHRLAFSTDSFVVSPMFFPGGSIGDLAVNGTVNDLAMLGATPLALATAFILEEGTPLTEVNQVACDLGAAARVAGVQLVTGDTKVVAKGAGDGVYITSAGIGLIPAGVDLRPSRVQVGDAVLVSGQIGLHGVAVMSKRAGLEFGTTVQTDCAPLHGLVAAMLATGADLHVLRDPTRGGVAASLNEIAQDAHVGVELTDSALPIAPEVGSACSFLGLDPLQVANEGKLVAFLPAHQADAVLAAMRAHEYGRDAVQIGKVVAAHPGTVVARTALGSTRVVAMPLGEQLPRIC